MAFFILFAALGLSGSLAAAQDTLASQVYCPYHDVLYNGLNGTTTHSGGLISCTYDTYGLQQPSPCSYFPGGQFYQGPNNSCPTSIAFFDFLCPSFDGMSTGVFGNAETADGNSLMSSSNDTQHGVPTRQCVWFYGGNGSFYDPEVLKSLPFCPPTINPAQLNSTKFNCLSNDTAGWPLIGSSATNGTFNSGPSACPISIAPGSGPVGTGVPVGAIAEGASAAAAAAASSSPDKKNGLPQPVIIALLALNGVLVVGVLGLGGFWVCRRHSGSTRSVDYTKVYASREGDYYDAPIEPYRPPSRIEQ
ncbi:hypothetical protein DFH06DRAFT_1197060 [Mycena polygramma]|nr:hypothetical protein DFH06DRAFT_1197060 [Mycena polygramma]